MIREQLMTHISAGKESPSYAGVQVSSKKENSIHVNFQHIYLVSHLKIA